MWGKLPHKSVSGQADKIKFLGEPELLSALLTFEQMKTIEADRSFLGCSYICSEQVLTRYCTVCITLLHTVLHQKFAIGPNCKQI